MNLWDRQQNKKAKVKKERAKQHAFSRVQNFGQETAETGTVVWVGKNTCVVHCNNEDVSYKTDGSLTQLVVGDVVYLESESVTGIQERQSFLARIRSDGTRYGAVSTQQVVVANIQKVVIVASVVQPAFHPRFIDRYLIACEQGNVESVICLTKTDLSAERPAALEEYRKLGISVLETSTATEEGILSLRELLTGCKAVFVGASGVGKSSLVNALLQGNVAVTGRVGEKTERGRHTTTSSQMYEWAKGSCIIDTPGIRSLGLENLAKNEIQYYFPEFEELRSQCKYSNCMHLNEPRCAIIAAVASGEVSKARYESYVRICEE